MTKPNFFSIARKVVNNVVKTTTDEVCKHQGYCNKTGRSQIGFFARYAVPYISYGVGIAWIMSQKPSAPDEKEQKNTQRYIPN